MFSIGFAELLLIAVVLLLVVGPERLPDTVRSISLQMAKFRRYWAKTRRDLEQEFGLDDIRREIHNAEVLEHLKETQRMLNEPVEAELERRAPGSTSPQPAEEEASDETSGDESDSPNNAGEDAEPAAKPGK